MGGLVGIMGVVGVGRYGRFSGHLFSLTGYRYSLANPPNAQSGQKPNTPDSQPPYQVIWNSCGGPPRSGCNRTSNGWREGTVPDPYDYFVSLTINVPLTVYFFTL